MVPLDKFRACSNPPCRLLLPADPDDESGAGFWVRRREDGRVRSWTSWCKDCMRRRSRERAGLKARGRPYGERVAVVPEDRARRRAEDLRRLKEYNAQRMATDPEYRRHRRGVDREQKRRRRREAGARPRYFDREVRYLAERGWTTHQIATHLRCRVVRVYDVIDPERAKAMRERERAKQRTRDRRGEQRWQPPPMLGRATSEPPFYRFLRELERGFR